MSKSTDENKIERDIEKDIAQANSQTDKNSKPKKAVKSTPTRLISGKKEADKVENTEKHQNKKAPKKPKAKVDLIALAEKSKAERTAKAEKAKADKAAKAEKAKAEKAAKAEKDKAAKSEKAAKAKKDKAAKAEKEKTEKAVKSKKTDIAKDKAQKSTEETNKSDTKKHKSKSEEEKSAPKAKQTKKKEKKPASEKKTGEKWSIKQLGGYLFAKMMRGGASELRANAEEVNKLNVFPVPDGDTGDNMSMTIESGVASLDNIDTDDLAEVLRVASRGMLLGARGNSGVILSQFFAGMAKGLENVEKADAKKLGHALEIGVEQAYTSVMTPTEGTILTVARESVEYAVKRLNSKSTVQSLFSDLVNEMNASLERTPEILPILGQAGVVDSGGAGLLYIIDGLNRVLNGEDVDFGDVAPVPKPKVATATEGSFGPDSEMDFGYCTELLVQLMNKKLEVNPFDLEAAKEYLATLGDSIVIFQTESIVKIHIHTLRPDKVMRYIRKFGEYINVKIENMSLQHTELQNEEKNEKKEAESTLPKKKCGIIAVSNGDGISSLFRDLGADAIVEGGQTNNPSTNDFIDAFGKINAESIFVFPNNGNIIMAASQAAEIYENAKVYVIPSKSVGAGYVAMSSMDFEGGTPEELVAQAEEAIGRIVSAYISPAVRDADMNGVHVTEGDTMGIVAKEIVISGPDKMASTYGLIETLLVDQDKFMLTVFYGKDATSEERDMLASYMATNHPMIEAYYIDGGQEIYPFLFVVE